jgi:hypothetical protein
MTLSDLLLHFCSGAGLGMLVMFTAYGFKAMLRTFAIVAEAVE